MKRFVAFVLLVVLCASLVLTVAMATCKTLWTDCSGCFVERAAFVCVDHPKYSFFYDICEYVPNQCEVRGLTKVHVRKHLSCGYGGGAYNGEETTFYHKTCGHDANIPPIILDNKVEKE